MNWDYELLVIGAGPGGLAAAESAANYGVRVAIAEQEQVGGTCVVHGCIPEKLMTYAAGFSKVFERADEYGWGHVSKNFDWCQFMEARNRDIQHLCQMHIQKLEKAGVELIKGHAKFIDAHTVDINGQEYKANKILIAVGRKAIKPEVSGIEYAITTRKFLELKHQPKHLAIIGSNYIAVKLAGMMNGLISKVTLVISDDKVLPGCDHALRTTVQDEMTRLGIRICTNSQVEKIERVQDCLNLRLSGSNEPVEVETVVWISDRVPKWDGLGLEKAGVEVKQGAIAVDEYSRTSQANIFAVGDCTARPRFTPVAIAAGRAFADTEFGDHPRIVDYDYVPYVVSSQPEAATVGLTQAQAKAQLGEAVRCYQKTFQSLLDMRAESPEQTLLKLVVDGNSDRIVGAQMVGDCASEIIQMIALAINAGVTKADFNHTIGIHPSIGEEFFCLSP